MVAIIKKLKVLYKRILDIVESQSRNMEDKKI